MRSLLLFLDNQGSFETLDYQKGVSDYQHVFSPIQAYQLGSSAQESSEF